MFFEEFGDSFDHVIAISSILRLVVRHNRVLVPDADEHCIFSFGQTRTTTALSAEVSDSFFALDEHKLGINEPDAGRAGLTVPVGCLKHAVPLVDLHRLEAPIILLKLKLILFESRPVCRRCPRGPICSVNARSKANIRQRVVLRFCVVLVLDLPDVRVPSI